VPDLSESPVGLAASPDDVVRSVRRWVGLWLPEPWDIQYQKDDDMERPAGLLVPATRVDSTGSAFLRDYQRDFDLFLYPTGFEADQLRSRVEAERLADEARRAFEQGVMVGGVRISRTMRLPVWDHADVDWDQDIPSGRDPFDWLPVRAFGVEARVDPDDDTLFVVVATFRIVWSGDGDLSRLDGPTLQDVRVGMEPT
jgi:hypothetical protein